MASHLLSLRSRADFQTLLDAVVLHSHNPEAIAITYLETGQPPQQISHYQFAIRAKQSAAALAELGVQARDLIIIAHTQNLESIFAFWGALLLGAIPSMMSPLTEKLDPDIYTQSIALVVKHAEAKLILTNDDFAPKLAQWVPCPVHGTLHLTEDLPAPPLYSPSTDEIAFLQHSSGTTGLQKGVALSHQAVLNQLASYGDSLNLQEDEVIVSWLPLYHDMGLIAGFLMPLIQGLHLVLMSPFDWVMHPAMMFKAIHDYGGTYCWLPNFAYNHSARRIRRRDTEELSLKTIRAFINCSEPVHHESHQLFLERFGALGLESKQLAVSYAMAENTFAVTQTPIGKAARVDIVDRVAIEQNKLAMPCTPEQSSAQYLVSCGAPITGVEVRIVNTEGEAIAERHIGEIAIRSSFMLTSYYRRPDLNADIWHDGWYLTGDMGYMADGELYVIGRKKDLIINAGKNIYPGDIEAIANTVAGVYPGRVVAFGVYDEREGTELIGLVAESEASDEDEKRAIAQAIRQKIAQQSTVTLSYVHIAPPRWLIKTSSGKIARAANRDKWLKSTQKG